MRAGWRNGWRMKQVFTSLQEVVDHGFDDVIDVRSPAEFAEDHWPGAINLPVLSNEERAEVGTLYKQVSPFQGRVIGAGLVTSNASAHLRGPLLDKPGSWRPLVYCWRGGQRSGFFAHLLREVGWRPGLVDGGYKAYRRLVVAAMHDQPLAHSLIVLDGNTGTAKTELLYQVASRGVQMVDLEGLARHRGSVFGHRPGGQPSQKAFESALALAFARLDPEKPVLVEAESSKIGNLNVPPAVWDAMKRAPRIELVADLDERARYLRQTYDDIFADVPRLSNVLKSLIPLQGHERVDEWMALVEARDFVGLCRALMQDHYDPRYKRSRAAHDVVTVPLQLRSLCDAGLAQAADAIIERIPRLQFDPQRRSADLRSPVR